MANPRDLSIRDPLIRHPLNTDARCLANFAPGVICLNMFSVFLFTVGQLHRFAPTT